MDIQLVDSFINDEHHHKKTQYFQTLDSDFWTDLNFIENSRLGTRTGFTKKQKTANRVLKPVSVILDRLNSFLGAREYFLPGVAYSETDIRESFEKQEFEERQDAQCLKT